MSLDRLAQVLHCLIEFPFNRRWNGDNCMRLIITGAALIACLPAFTARAASELNGDQIVVAMAVDTAIFAAEKCPGFRIVDGSIFENVRAAGVSPEQTLGQEWKNAMLLGDTKAKDGYAQNPSRFCERAWRMLGPPNHTFKHQLLEKLTK
jgi:hypothetical protein